MSVLLPNAGPHTPRLDCRDHGITHPVLPRQAPANPVPSGCKLATNRDHVIGNEAHTTMPSGLPGRQQIIGFGEVSRGKPRAHTIDHDHSPCAADSPFVPRLAAKSARCQRATHAVAEHLRESVKGLAVCQCERQAEPTRTALTPLDRAVSAQPASEPSDVGLRDGSHLCAVFTCNLLRSHEVIITEWMGK
jgi:hypothetical protein